MFSKETLKETFKKAVYEKRYVLYSLAIAILLLGICSKSSPIYPFNDWADANCYMTVGKSIVCGKVPYKDLIEQKGPILYFVHALVSLISNTSFVGVWFLEIIAATAFLSLCYKIIKLLSENSIPQLWIPIIAAIVYSSKAFCHGDSCEELSLPFVTYALYVGAKAIKDKTVPSGRECFIIGITSACILWTKFTLLGVYFGWAIFFFIFALVGKQLPELFKRVLPLLLGIVVVTVPVLLYFVINGAISDLFRVYFYDNMFNYGRNSSDRGFFDLVWNMLRGAKVLLQNQIILLALILIEFVGRARKKELPQFRFILLTAGTMYFFVYFGGVFFPYYSLIFSAFIPFCVLTLDDLLRKLMHKLKLKLKQTHIRTAVLVIPLLCMMFAYLTSSNIYFLKYEKSDLPQYRFAQIIDQKEDATLLTYGWLDSGFYTTTGIVPNCRYFCALNLPYSGMKEEQDEYVRNMDVDFIVVRDQICEFSGYSCVDQAVLYYEGVDHTYFLFQRISTSDQLEGI